MDGSVVAYSLQAGVTDNGLPWDLSIRIFRWRRLRSRGSVVLGGGGRWRVAWFMLSAFNYLERTDLTWTTGTRPRRVTWYLRLQRSQSFLEAPTAI